MNCGSMHEPVLHANPLTWNGDLCEKDADMSGDSAPPRSAPYLLDESPSTRLSRSSLSSSAAV